MHAAAEHDEDAIHDQDEDAPATSVGPGAEHLVLAAEQPVQSPRGDHAPRQARHRPPHMVTIARVPFS